MRELINQKWEQYRGQFLKIISVEPNESKFHMLTGFCDCVVYPRASDTNWFELDLVDTNWDTPASVVNNVEQDIRAIQIISQEQRQALLRKN